MADQLHDDDGEAASIMSMRFEQQQRQENAASNGSDTGDVDDEALEDNGDDVDGDGKKDADLVLPKALEDVLALKDQRVAEFDTDVDGRGDGGVSQDGGDFADIGEDSDDDADNQVNGVSNNKAGKQSKADKNKKKKRRKKQNKKIRQKLEYERQQQLARRSEPTQEPEPEEEPKTAAVGSDDDESPEKDKDIQRESRSKKKKDRGFEEKEKTKERKKSENGTEDDVTIEYVPEKITIADLAPMYRQFYRVFEIFKLENKPKPVEKDKAALDAEALAKAKKSSNKLHDDDDDDVDDDEDNKEDKEKLSKRKLKKLTRLSVAELKQLVSRPDVVEMHDVTARDPKLLVQLKAYRNTVQVPRHWCFKRKYLQGKRGIEKPPFDLPAFIKKTGIMEMRESLQEREDAKTLKAKMRERVRPKMGKIDIDYQKLHDAFFKWQTKPRMTIHGDLYYEGKEFETRLKEKKPGDLSEELRIALGMPVGPNSHKIPPPWLIAQQRYGPPPSYPNLKIPGLNAPIPEGTSFGYHAGGWGKPPVDENGKPLYGDVFGMNTLDLDNGIDEADIERNQWGELESESEESSEEEEEDGEDLGNQQDETGLVTPVEGLVTPSGLTSVPAGMETPENIELRKKKIEAEMEDNETPVLYQVLPEKRTDRIGASMMGSTHVYDIGGGGVAGANKQPAVRSTTDREGIVELALDPSELDLDNDAMAQRYEQQMREQQNHLQKEDLSDMLAEHVARQKSKRKRQQTDPAKATKKYKEFKF
ncbi:LOW QUALITY PROTEIN: splicing factor 3B subunit 2 [Drosophila sulfurigaster albostrigata]|uniref:LOW QUALITY PROTEIN: splicing factor 3B subunit 2 n=1 Tax=Drosophila sulfurigaster albostrigata TaxID=89887 RepID=UPI002D21D403|nr:LOW QUALITY PROTEIN: splicing factor 3B subunit 2 [Drosophila sulfurigaster albostrigata]